jgi:hypothetical protein
MIGRQRIRWSSPWTARLFMATAVALAAGASVAALQSYLESDVAHGFLLTAVAVFSGWMATAIHQFQERLSGIDEVVRQARRRVEQSEQTLAEMRQLALRLRSQPRDDESEEDRTLH